REHPEEIRGADRLQWHILMIVNEKGRIDFWHDWLSRALSDVEASRIRRCQNCGKIYWAGRIDQPCCSKSCANIRRVTRSIQNSARYKVNRCKAEDRREKADIQKKGRRRVLGLQDET